MKNTKRSITFKVLAGYLLLTAFTVVSVWFIYEKIENLTQANSIGNTNNEKLFLISEAVTNLYTAEGISRDIIQNQRPENLPKFNAQIDTISILIDSLKRMYADDSIQNELDSINHILSLKEQNLIDLLNLRKENSSNNYYDRVLNQLAETNYIFEDDNYEEVVEGLEPFQRRAILNWLEYAKEDNANNLTQQSADSLIRSMKTVLSELEVEERRYQNSIAEKENELLENDRELSSQLRKLRSEIEQEEIQKSVDQVTASQETLEETSEIIAVLGIACLLTILFFIVLIIKDTNRSQRYRKELEKSKAYAEFLLKRREQFMATVTHDLRSPLNTIVGYTDLLKKTELNDKQGHYLNQLKKSSGYILRLVNDLLDFSKLEAGKMMVEKLPFNPHNLIKDSVSGVIPSEDPKNLNIDISIAEELNKNFLSDPFRIQQILTNLIANAYKFTDNGSIKIIGELDSSSIKRNLLKITIQDTGIGISKEQEKIIFEEFSQAKASIEKQYGGSGLGLAITKKIINLLGGKIELQSKIDHGSSFIVSIPVENAKHVASEKTTKHLSIKKAENHHILIVDDEATQLALTSEVVKQAGFTFETTTDATEALKKAKKSKFSLILSDIQMPKMNGFEFVRHLKKNKKTRHIPIIALSGRTEVSQDIYSEKGFETNIIKPFHAHELLTIMARILQLETETVYSEENEEKPTSSKSFSPKLYNLDDLKIFTDNDPESLNAILQTFIENSEINLEELHKEAEKENLQQIAFIAHKMLPMYRQLKAETVISPLERLEKQNEYQLQKKEVLSLTDEASDKIKTLLSELRKIVNRN